MASLIPKVNATTGSATAPGANALVTGELAENKFTGRLYVKTESAAVVDPARVTLSGDVTGSTATATSEAQGGTIACTLATVGVSKGGTGLTATPANGQIPIGNATGYTLATITAGTNVTITNGAGAITISSSGSSITVGTPIATTSGTAIDITGIPATAKIIYVSLAGVTSNGANAFLLQLGTSGGVQATGYLGAGSLIRSGVSSASYTTGFGIRRDAATLDMNGVLALTLLDSSNGTWACGGVTAASTDLQTNPTGGSKVLNGTLDRLRLTSTATDVFNAGKINITYLT